VVPRTIVFVLDSSKTTKDQRLAWALSLARWYAADLHVVHVRSARRIAAAIGRTSGEALVRRIERLVDAVGAAGVDVRTAVLSGSPVRAIAEYSGRVGAELVIVTNRRRCRGGYWFAGAFATSLGKAVAAPTIVLPGGLLPCVRSSRPFRTIVTAIDFSDASLRALSDALTLAQLNGGRLKLVHVLDGLAHQTVRGGSDALRLGRAFRASAARINRELQSMIPSDALHWSDVETTTVFGPTHAGILAQAADEGADLIVLGMPRCSRVIDLMAGSTVHKVLRRATSPVLLVPGPSAAARAEATDDRAQQLGYRRGAAVSST
jgi:nucleotide-binding universal stress UspA family protein